MRVSQFLTSYSMGVEREGGGRRKRRRGRREEGEEEEENDERMVGEVEVRCVGSGMQGVCVWRCVYIFFGVFQRRKNACTFGCCLCGTFDVSMWSRWCRAAIVALVKCLTWCACLWNSA